MNFRNYLLKSYLLFVTSILTTSCFKEDIPISPVSQEVISITESIYNYQSFVDLGSRQIVSSNPVDSWDLGFESGAGGNHIIINSGKLLGVYSSGASDFDQLITVPSDAGWTFDKSDGLLDSTALHGWISPDMIPTKEVFFLGINDGFKYIPWKKIVFTTLINGEYAFKYANPDGSDKGTFTIKTDNSTSFVYFSFTNGGSQVMVEPPKNSWDFLFSQYSTILYTEEGVPTPYFVRGVLINRNGVAAALDSVTGFSDLTLADVSRLQFSSKSDAIGHDWKSVKVDGTSATYGVRQNYSYIIRSHSGLYYKLCFKGFFNDEGSPGYPKFEVQELK